MHGFVDKFLSFTNGNIHRLVKNKRITSYEDMMILDWAALYGAVVVSGDYFR